MRPNANDLNLEYIRERYGVPAYRGAKVVDRGEKGTIFGADGSYVKAMFESQPRIRVFHPKDLKYIGVAAV